PSSIHDSTLSHTTLFRSYIGSWIFDRPAPLPTREYLKERQKYLEKHFDQLCWDPVLLAPDKEPTPPPVHRHSGWWPDPRTGEIADRKSTRLNSSHGSISY